MADEKTSPEVAAIAARVVKMTDNELAAFAMVEPSSLRSMAGSVLTQAPDREDRQ